MCIRDSIYAIPVDPEKGLESIQLPDAPGIKITAISVADSDYLRVAQEPDVYKRQPLTWMSSAYA